MQTYIDMLKMQLVLQSGAAKNPLTNLMVMSGFDLAVRTYPTWSETLFGCCRRKRVSAIPQSSARTPRASITCERGTPQQHKNAVSTTLYGARMDAVVHSVTTRPAMKTLLSVTHHDYLPHEFDPVCLDADVYFELNDLNWHQELYKDTRVDAFSEHLLTNHNIWVFHNAALDGCDLVFKPRKEAGLVPSEIDDFVGLMDRFFERDDYDKMLADSRDLLMSISPPKKQKTNEPTDDE